VAVNKKTKEQVKKDKGRGRTGRPKELPGDKCDLVQVERLAGLGFIDEEIAGIIGVCIRTFTTWKKDAEFIAILKRGKAVQDAKVVQSLLKQALGYQVCEKTYEAIKYGAGQAQQGKVSKHQLVKTVIKNIQPSVTAAIFWLKNRQPDRWRDRPIDTSGDQIPDSERDAITSAMDTATTPRDAD